MPAGMWFCQKSIARPNKVTFTLANCKCAAAARPYGPAPMTATWQSLLECIIVTSRDFAAGGPGGCPGHARHRRFPLFKLVRKTSVDDPRISKRRSITLWTEDVK